MPVTTTLLSGTFCPSAAQQTERRFSLDCVVDTLQMKGPKLRQSALNSASLRVIDFQAEGPHRAEHTYKGSCRTPDAIRLHFFAWLG